MGADGLINAAKNLNPATQISNAAAQVENSASNVASTVGDAITSAGNKVASWFEPAPANATPENNYAARKQQEDDAAFAQALIAQHPELDAANQKPSVADGTPDGLDAKSGIYYGTDLLGNRYALNPDQQKEAASGAMTGLDPAFKEAHPNVATVHNLLPLIGLAMGVGKVVSGGMAARAAEDAATTAAVPLDIQGTSASSPNLPNTSEHFQALLDHPDATPELKSAVQSLKPAIRDPETGDVYLANDPNAKTHADVFGDLPQEVADKSKLDTGFVGPDNEYMTRQQAADHLIAAQATGTPRPVTPEVMVGPPGASATATSVNAPVSEAAGGTEAAPAASVGSGADVASPAAPEATPAGAAQSLAERQIAALKAVRVGKGVAEEFGRPDIATEVPESLTMEESQALRQNLESYYAQGTTPPELPAHVQALASTYQEENQAIHAFNTDLRARAANGEDVSGDLDQLVNRWSAMAENYSTLAGQRTALGRGLQILDPNKPGNAFVAATSRLAQEVGLEDNPQRLSDLLASMTPDQYGRVGRQMASDVSLGRSLYNGLNEYYINNLLSDVGRTSSKIGVSNAVSGLLTLPTRAIAAAMPGSPFKFGEPLAGMQGMVDGFWHSVDVALESLKTGERVSQIEGGVTPFADESAPKAISAEGFGLGSADPATGHFNSSGIGKGVDFLGSVLRLPLRGLTAVHQFGHSMATSMAGHMLAWRDAIDTAASEGLDGFEGYSRAQEIYRQTLNDMPDPMRQAAAREADVTTFANQLEGIAADSQKVLQYPVLKQFMPFFKVAYNVKKMGADMTPVVGQLTQASDVLYGSPAERSTALAKQAFGAVMAIMIAHETTQGNITGDGPPPGAARDALMASGWRPNSIKMGDHYYGVPEPLAFPFSTIANYTELRDQMDDPTAFQKALAISQATGRAFANDSIVQGLVNLKTAWNAASTGDSKAWEKFAGQEASGMVPFSALLKAGARAQDPTIRNPSTIGQQIETGIPGMQANVPPKYDIYGKPMIGMPGVPENLLYPVNVTKAGKLDKVDQAIVDTQANFERVPSYISGRAQRAMDDPNDPDIGVPLTPQEQEKWAQLRGAEMKAQLIDLLDTPSIKAGSTLLKKQMIEWVGAKLSQDATLKLLEDPTKDANGLTLKDRYTAREYAKKGALTPPDALTPDADATSETEAGAEAP